jgi:transposase
MIDLENIDHIYLYPGYTDLRKGRNSLSHMSVELAKNDKEHKLFIFCNRKTKLIKIYEKDETGVWVYIRSLDESNFGWPRNMKEALEINRSQIEWLLKGLKFITCKKKKENSDYY